MEWIVFLSLIEFESQLLFSLDGEWSHGICVWSRRPGHFLGLMELFRCGDFGLGKSYHSVIQYPAHLGVSNASLRQTNWL